MNIMHIPTGRLQKALGIRIRINKLESELLRTLSEDKRRNARSPEVRRKIGEGIRKAWEQRKAVRH